MSVFTFKAWPTEYKYITQDFGANPQDYLRFGLDGHEGVDIRAFHSSKIFAVADGIVYRVCDKRKKLAEGGHNYGVHIRIKHTASDGVYKTIYAHLDKRLVGVGDIVRAGDVIGLADDTGNSFGSHLHLSLKKVGAGNRGFGRDIIDPSPYINQFLTGNTPKPNPHKRTLKTGVKIYSSPDSSSKVVAWLSRGLHVETVDNVKGGYIRISFPYSGWIWYRSLQ